MSVLSKQLATHTKEIKARASAEALQVIEDTTQALQESGIADRAVQAGGRVPGFCLTNQQGSERSLEQYLAAGPLVLSFYRGGWCPYCGMELGALQKELPRIAAAGGQVAAIAPETPESSLLNRERFGITYDVLFDQGAQVASDFRLAFVVPEPLRSIYADFGIDIPACNGDDSYRLPVSATYIIDRDSTVAYRYFDVDYAHRLEPEIIVEELEKL
ncbi:peroxiredoxin-like family protein [Pseudodesulfovibrio sp.]|uniref:peroxiredoxin-like family protein n=1 Tax=unclassified Pseudodesulfovibrio TaxID=2661612 RepID=UPI003AFFD766